MTKKPNTIEVQLGDMNKPVDPQLTLEELSAVTGGEPQASATLQNWGKGVWVRDTDEPMPPPAPK